SPHRTGRARPGRGVPAGRGARRRVARAELLIRSRLAAHTYASGMAAILALLDGLLVSGLATIVFRGLLRARTEESRCQRGNGRPVGTERDGITGLVGFLALVFCPMAVGFGVVFVYACALAVWPALR